jgi:nanoRNase/pAp phosphatase (c-di-AMP/oligoRNAs hydrolase)
MLRHLKVQMIPGDRIDYREYDLVALVDSQPGFRYHSMPPEVIPQIVIDHHPPSEGSIPEGTELALIEEHYGASASIVGEIIAANSIPVPEDVATALVFGIKTETQDLGREAGEPDVAVYSYLYPLANKRLMSRIESERVPQNYFREFAKAIQHAQVYDFVVTSDLGVVEVPDMVAEMADFLLRLEGARWSFVTGTCGDTLYVSVRASEESLSAGEAIAAAISGAGSCGGHASMAGGQVPLAAVPAGERWQVASAVTERFLESVKAKRSLCRPLLPPEEGSHVP